MEGKPLNLMRVNEMGEVVHQVFSQPDQFKGKMIGLVSDRLTISQCADIFMKHFPDRKYVATTVCSSLIIDYTQRNNNRCTSTILVALYWQKIN